MTAGFRRALASFPFALRLLIFLTYPLFCNVNSPLIFSAFVLLMILSWTMDLIIGRTFWLTLQPGTYVWQILYSLLLAFAAFANSSTSSSPFTILWLAPFLLLSLNSDAISNANRWQILLPLTTLSWLVFIIMLPKLSPPSSAFLYGVPYSYYVYGLLPGVSCIARLIFPRTKDLIHTSLDSPPLRIEILSYGLKHPAAVGLKLH